MYEFIKEKEIEKIVLEHVINSKKVEDSAKDLLKHAFKQIVSRILLQVKLHIENSNQYKSIESVYLETIELKNRYESYLQLDYNEDVPTENEKDVIRGVFHSIHSALDAFPNHSENPLEYERMLIVSTGLLRLREEMNRIQDDIVYSFELPSSLHIDFGDILTNHIVATYNDRYDDLVFLVEGIVSELNDPAQRVELNSYLNFLHEQESILKSFIHINLETGQEWHQQNESNELTAKYIYPIQQLYQDIHTTISDIKQVINKKAEQQPLVIKDIDNIIEANIIRDKRLKELIAIVEDDKKTTIDSILLHINDELTKASAIEFKKMKKSSLKFELLSYIILELFEESIKCIDRVELDEIQNDTHRKIIQGVTDSLHLKYDSLKDKDNKYHMAKKEDYLVYSEGFIDFKNIFEQNCEMFLEEAINGSNLGFNKAQSKFVRYVEKEFESNLSKDLDYYKKEILFEINTLEDLIHQSVDKLNSSEEPACLKFAECVEKLYINTLNQLRRNDIIQIRPKEHESFNGKMHEIIIAEEAEGFEKGEIIRTSNSGFIYDARILVRASVIAAK
jgi:molecular chaperone GrpE (heat shock protein)